MNYLEKIIHRKNLEIKTERFSFEDALKKPGLSVIAEIKRKSPSVGKICKMLNPTKLALDYVEAGASAISVLTDKDFGGSLEDLKQVSLVAKVPLLRKDFIFAPIQLAEAALHGASAVLLIVRILGKQLKSMILLAEQLGLESLVEVHDENELKIALEAEAKIIGINHRNLDTFLIDFTVSKLRKKIPTHIITVAESGIRTREQAKQMEDLGFDAVLVGEALVRSQDPKKLIEQMRQR